jgi:phosphohistidine phosphatase SixA
MGPTHYVLLCRHGETASTGPAAAAPLSKSGRKQTHLIGRRLAETIALDDALAVRMVWRGSHQAAVETERILRSEIGQENRGLPEAKECKLLDPEQFRPYAIRTRADTGQGGTVEQAVIGKLREQLADEPDGSAALIVGHQPMLSWVGEALLSQPSARWSRHGLPVGREVACIAIEQRRRFSLRRSQWLAWSIESSDPDTEDLLRQKIEAKIDIAKFLAGILIFGLGVVLGVLLDAKKLKQLHVARPHSDILLPLAGASFFLAIGLFLATMYAYDRLLMPRRFWSESPPSKRSRPRWLVRRPPSSGTYVLYQNMIRVWQRLFLPGTFFVMTGIGLLGYVALDLNWWEGAIAGATALGVIACYLAARPHLGTED